MTALPPVMQVILAALVITAGAFDIRCRKIPNWLVLIGLLAGVCLSFIFLGAPGLKASCLGAALAFAIYFPLFALRALGAGDLKLMVAVGAFTGPSNWMVLFVIASVLGGVIALAVVLYRGQLGRTLRNVLLVLAELLHLRPPYRRNPELDVASPEALRLPHAVSIAGGTLLFLMLDHFKA